MFLFLPFLGKSGLSYHHLLNGKYKGRYYIDDISEMKFTRIVTISKDKTHTTYDRNGFEFVRRVLHK